MEVIRSGKGERTLDEEDQKWWNGQDDNPGTWETVKLQGEMQSNLTI